MKFWHKITLGSIKARILVFFSGLMILIFILVFIRNFTFTVKGYTERYLYQYGTKATNTLFNLKKDINKGINTSLYLANDFENVKLLPETDRRSYIKMRLHKTLEFNEDFLAIWCFFKPYTIDTFDRNYENRFIGYKGNFMYTVYRRRYKIYQDTFRISDYQNLYIYSDYFLKTKEHILIVAPDNVKYPSLKEKYKITIIAPIIENAKVIGLTGVDLPISSFDKIFGNNKTLNFIFNEEDIIIYHTKHSEIGNKITNAYLTLNVATASSYFDKLIENEKIDKFYTENLRGKQYFILNKILKIDETGQKWIFSMAVPYNMAKNIGTKASISFFLAFLVIVFFILFIGLMTANVLHRNIKYLNRLLENLSKGEYKELTNKSAFWIASDIKKVAKIIKNIGNELNKRAEFAEYLSRGDYSYQIQPLGKNDQLSIALLKLKQTLEEKEKQEQERRKQQKITNWKNEAIATVNDILRHYTEVEKFSMEIVKFVVNYINAIQGGMFVLKEDKGEEYLDLEAFYSYNREVFYKKRVSPGEGLVGSCALEKKTVYTHVPENYIEITSGMGRSKPNYLLIVPMIYENEVYGILELTFLENFSEPKIKLTEEIANIVAAELASARITEHTKKLLQESQKSAELLELKQQELEKTLQEFEKFKIKYTDLTERMRSYQNALGEFAFVAEFDRYFNTVFVNRNLIDVLNTTYSDALASDFFILLSIQDIPKYEKILEKALSGEKVKFDFNIAVSKTEKIWIKAVMVPLYTSNNQIDGLLFIGFDNTEVYQKMQEIQKITIELSETKEQLEIQNLEFDSIIMEYETLSEQLEAKEDEIRTKEKEIEKVKKSLEFFKKELEKRIKRSKKIEQNLKEKNKNLQEEIERLKQEIQKLKENKN